MAELGDGVKLVHMSKFCYYFWVRVKALGGPLVSGYSIIKIVMKTVGFHMLIPALKGRVFKVGKSEFPGEKDTGFCFAQR